MLKNNKPGELAKTFYLFCCQAFENCDFYLSKMNFKKNILKN